MSTISVNAVINYLRTRKASVDFMRDVLETEIEDGNVTVKITDKISGGATHHVSEFNIHEFESTYGASNEI